MPNGRQRSESFGEFKGSTSTKLEILFVEIKEMRKDIEGLKNWKWWSMGFGAASGFLAGFFKDMFIRK